MNETIIKSNEELKNSVKTYKNKREQFLKQQIMIKGNQFMYRIEHQARGSSHYHQFEYATTGTMTYNTNKGM